MQYKQVWGKPIEKHDDLFDQSSGHPKVPYVSIVEVGEWPNQGPLMAGSKVKSSYLSTKESSFLLLVGRPILYRLLQRPTHPRLLVGDA